MTDAPPTQDVPATQPVAWPSWAIWFGAFLIASVLYWATAAPGVLWGDFGEAQLRVLTCQLQDLRELARSHVTYFATACGISRLFGSNPIQTANFVSAFAGAVTIANFAALLSLLVRGRIALIGGTCLLMFSHTLWQMSAGAEVITFSTMFLSLELLCIVRYLSHGSFFCLACAALVNGLGWSTHNFALLTWPAYVALTIANRHWISGLNWKRAITIGAMWLVGVAPLVLSVISRREQFEGLSEAARSVLVGVYGDKVFNLRITTSMAFRLIAYHCLNFPTPLLILLPVGIWQFAKSNPRPIAWFMIVAASAFFGFAARYNVPDQYTFLTHSHIFIALFLAVGLDQILGRMRSIWIKSLAILLSCLAPIAYASVTLLGEEHLAKWVSFPKRILPYRDPYRWFLQPWRCGYNGAARYARESLDSLPKDAVLLIDSTAGRPIDVVQGSEGLRLDVAIPMQRFDRPWQRSIKLDKAETDRLVDEGLLFSTGTRNPKNFGKWLAGDRYELEPFGHLFKINHASTAAHDREPPSSPLSEE